jgi:cardiolipin synthase
VVVNRLQVVVPLTVVPDWVTSLPAILAAALVLLDIAVIVAALGVIPGNRRPSTGMAWLILVIAVPLFGLLAFLMFGSTRVERKRQRTQVQVNKTIHRRTAEVGALVEEAPNLAYVASVATLNRRLGALPAVAGNSAELFSDYLASIAAMTREVDSATRFVHVQFYITAWDGVTDDFFRALVRATDRGVTVRLLLDHLGSRGTASYKATLERLRGTRIEWHLMLPIKPLRGKVRRVDLRNHRKILVVDGVAGFAGSQNLIAPSYNKASNLKQGRTYVELTTRIEGPVVMALNAVFLTDWFSETGEVLEDTIGVVTTNLPDGGMTAQVVPSGPGGTNEKQLRSFTTLLYTAEHRISISSA